MRKASLWLALLLAVCLLCAPAALADDGSTADPSATASATATTADPTSTAPSPTPAPTLSLDKQALEFCPGDTAALIATDDPAGSAGAISWATSNADVADVSAGTVTAKAVGTADITAASADGTLTAVCHVTVKSAAIETSVYTVDRPSGLLLGITKYTAPDVLLGNIANAPGDLQVLNPSGAPYASGPVGTGMTVKLTVGGSERDSLKLVVTGDTNGDGLISISDYTQARMDILGLKKLEGAFQRAGDVNGDGAITITDYTLMRMDILGLKPLGNSVQPVKSTDDRVNALLSYSMTLLGKPYVWGTEGPDEFDCSGFVYYCLNHVGYRVGRSTADTYSKYTAWRLIDKNSIQPGDLLFFYSQDHPGTIGHIGIYMGNGYFINASQTNACVIVSPLTGSNLDRLSHARRVFT